MCVNGIKCLNTFIKNEQIANYYKSEWLSNPPYKCNISFKR